jgi:hypothetical protein
MEIKGEREYSGRGDRPAEGRTITGYDFTAQAPLRRNAAMREKCLECCSRNSAEVARCQMVDCALWPYRSGRLNRGQEIVQEDETETPDE